MNRADHERLVKLLNRINQRDPQRDDDLSLLARGYEDMALEAARLRSAYGEPQEGKR
jgi:hypothetical protein